MEGLGVKLGIAGQIMGCRFRGVFILQGMWIVSSKHSEVANRDPSALLL